LYGIPLNVLLNSKSLNIEKFLNVKTIIDANLEDDDIIRKLKCETGLITKLNTRNLKNSFEDFKEAIQEGSGYIFKSLFDDGIFQQEKAFSEHDVLVYLQELKFDNQNLLIKLLKIVQILPNQMMSENKDSNKFNSKDPTEIVNTLVSNVALGLKESKSDLVYNIVEDEGAVFLEGESPEKSVISVNPKKNKSLEDLAFTTKLKQEELRKYKESIFSKSIPTQVKIFWICVVVFVLLQLIVGVIELYFTILNVIFIY